MRGFPLLLPALLLGGCSQLLPLTHPGQAWVEVRHQPPGQLQLVAVDGQPLEASRFANLTPGSHQLELRQQFLVSANNTGGAALPRDCRVTLQYAHFNPETHYYLTATNQGFRPMVHLRDNSGQPLVLGEEKGCLSVAEEAIPPQEASQGQADSEADPLPVRWWQQLQEYLARPHEENAP